MKYELILLLKQRSMQGLILLSLILTCLSLHNGWQNIVHIRTQIHHAQQAEIQRKQDYLQNHQHNGTLEAGELGYYLFHTVYQAPAEWSFIALGNRLVTPSVQRIRLLGLQGQMYDGESHHPEYVMLGGFDYAYWLVFFAPLLCIALLHDVQASEHQAQRLVFLNSMVVKPVRFWWHRVMARYLLIIGLYIIPLLAFAAWHALSSGPLLRIVITSLLYILFWTTICSVVSLHRQARNPSFNAMLLTSVWLLCCVVMPNLVQLWYHKHMPVEDGGQIAIQHRQLVHRAWDLPKTDTLTPFYALYPQWRDSPPVNGRFHWKWYYAFQHMADVRLAPQVAAREQALLQREQTSEQLRWLLPSVWAQRSLENIAESNVTHLLAHRQQIERFHTALRHALYPHLFEEKPLTVTQFKQWPVFANLLAEQ